MKNRTLRCLADNRSLKTFRKQTIAKREKSHDISEIRVVRKKSSEKNERSPSGELRISKLKEHEKMVRSLRKKLRSIEELMKKQENGESLNENQLSKIDSIDQFVDQLSKFA